MLPKHQAVPLSLIAMKISNLPEKWVSLFFYSRKNGAIVLAECDGRSEKNSCICQQLTKIGKEFLWSLNENIFVWNSFKCVRTHC